MPDSKMPEMPSVNETQESFANVLEQFERSHTIRPVEGTREGVVISISADSVFIDIGLKTEGILPSAEVQKDSVKPGDKLQVTIKGRDPEGYYELTRGKTARPADWTGLQRAFMNKTTIVGKVTGVVRGGLSVDVGVRAFLPASRSGARDAAEMARLVEQEIQCRITKLDETDQDVVVDRRIVAEEQEALAKDRIYAELKEGDTVSGTVRSLTDYGAFVSLGGVDALLHVSDMSRSRLNRPSDLLVVGQEIEAKVLRVDTEKRRVSIGIKQMQPEPWEKVQDKYRVGERVRGTVTRTTDFGAFVEMEPGVEGLIHVSEMSWVKRVKKPSDLVKVGETVEAVVLGINLGEKRMSLGLKQALGDPWADISTQTQVGSVVEGPVVSLTKFGAFVQVAEGIEGMIHVSDLSAEKRINHPQDILKVGQSIRAQVLEIDPERRRLKLGIKQLAPTSIDEYLDEHQERDLVSGRVLQVSGNTAQVELGEGIQATCRVAAQAATDETSAGSASTKTDLSSLTSMLQARWKSGGTIQSSRPHEIQPGQVRSFRIIQLERATRKIEVELA